MQELPKQYRPAEHEDRIFDRWMASKAFHADPTPVLSGEREPYCVLIPPPNVTAALHLGHALNNTIQDILVRAHRMMGYETLWMPGTDHAGIATQAVVEKRVMKEEKKRRTDFTREQFIAKIQAFKDEYEATITNQLKKMGCSCDWERQRFTMDPICARAVREAFFRLFRDGLIYRGKRLVNWDPVLQTAIADDEIENIEIDGAFYYLRYPLVRPAESGKVAEWQSGKVKDATTNASSSHSATLTLGHSATSPVTWSELARAGYPGAEGMPADERAYVTVATTRPETYLGDTAVAINPRDPRAKALQGLHVELPLVGRVIPVIADEYVVMPSAKGPYGAALNLRESDEPEDPKAAFATGFLKVTPAHDPNDYELGRKHGLPMINVMAPDASISDKHGWTDVGDAHLFVGRKREEARKLVVKEFEARGLLEKVQPYRHTVGHSDRSKAAIEPYLSDQWYVRVTDDRLSGSANRALVRDQRTNAGHPPARSGEALARVVEAPARFVEAPARSAEAPTRFVEAAARSAEAPTRSAKAHSATPGDTVDGDGSLRFHPARYSRTYELWHDNIRDWCISRQLWWGHRIPVWSKKVTLTAENWFRELDQNPYTGGLSLGDFFSGSVPGASVRCFNLNTGHEEPIGDLAPLKDLLTGDYIIYICLLDDAIAKRHRLESFGFEQDPDVLDTWFSSALWPISTLAWPEDTDALRAFNPSSTLCTAREIITLWVSRMVMFNRYFRQEVAEWQSGEVAKCPTPGPHSATLPLGHSATFRAGPVPFRDVFIHSVIQDGEGRKMSKTLGNGVDPLDIIATHGADAMRFTLCHMTTQTQDVRMPVVKDSASGKNTSPKFDLGRNFANKLWNAARFALGILGDEKWQSGEVAKWQSDKGTSPDAAGSASSTLPLGHSATLPLVDRWMLSRLSVAVEACNTALKEFQFADYATTMYDLLWRDFCDWYLEAIKPTVAGDPRQRAVLAATLDTILRLLHPVMPYVTEAIYEQSRTIRTDAVPGIELGDARKDGLLATAGWPKVSASLRNENAEREFEELRGFITAIREVRAQHNVAPKRKVTLHFPPQLLRGGSFLGDLMDPTNPVHTLVPTLAGVATMVNSPPKGPSVSFPFSAHEFKVSDLADEATMDTGAEKARLEKLVADLDKSIATFEGRLANPGYAQKAPPHMVQQTKDQLEKAKAERAAAAATLATLS